MALALLVAVAAATSHSVAQSPASPPVPRWPEAVEKAVGQAGDNAAQLRLALDTAPAAQRESLAFLLENMPVDDLRTLSARYLLDDIAQATDAFTHAPWADAVPEEIFLNDVLPYVNASERRDDWRADLRVRCAPMVVDCRTPGEAARRLNERLFPAVHVRYSTARAKADQSPAETMASGLASCTGLSILLVDACRAVGVPARLAGIPDWTDGRGNHTWAEVWDGGRWHFVGAAEPDAKGLDHAWFERDAALAQKDAPQHAIYAVSFRRTGLPFPIAWGPHTVGVDAENVTERYAAAPVAEPAASAATTRVMIRLRARADGPRVAAKVSVKPTEAADPTWEGSTKDETADPNDMLTFDLPRGGAYEITARQGASTLQRRYATEDKPQETLDLAFQEAASIPPPAPGGPDAAHQEALADALTQFYAASPEQQADWHFDPGLDQRLRQAPATVRRLAWAAFRASPAHASLRADHAARQVRFQEYVSPYTVREVGTKPPGGWGMVIALHGGGGAPKEVNDSQWRIMGRYYRDQPQLGGYLYVALRAPNDTWNGFYDDYVYPLVADLLRQFAVCEDVDLNKVDLIGYSHGGYGAFAIGPKMPDRFAAIHSSAAAPTDGETSARTLRNTPFSFWVGEFDAAYDRRQRCEAFARTLQALRGPRPDIFPYTFEVKTGCHHSDLPDHDELREMLPLARDPVPRELTWEQTDGVVRDFYWLRDEHPAKQRDLDARCRDNVVTLHVTKHPEPFTVLLDERLVDWERPVRVDLHDDVKTYPVQPELRVLCQEIVRRGDPDLAASARLEIFPGLAVDEKVPRN